MQVYAAYWAALEVRDLGRVLGVVGDLRAHGWSSTEVIEGLVVPAQTRVGELWLSGILPISGEHAMTSINEAVVASLSGDDPDGGTGPPVVVACLDPEEHVLAAAVVAIELRALGAPVHLVPDTVTAGELVRTVERLAGRAVLLSVTMASSLVSCRAVLRDLHEASIPVVVGGRAWGAESGRALTWGASHAPTVPAAWRLLAGPPKLLTTGSASD
uniref:cobalamin B12-binding domain-containing protein n=1 Tax=Nocardioides sp. TaxID=35761 RepID=UPI002B274EC2